MCLSTIRAVPSDDLESRFTRLEHDVDRLREEVASARALAALVDRDVAEFRTEMRGHRQTLNALRETQLEQGQQIVGLHQEISGLHQGISGLHQGIIDLGDEMREGLASQATGMAQITTLLATIAARE